MAAASTRTGSIVLDDIAEVIGEEAAFALAWEFRGLRLYVPKNPAQDEAIAKAIGTAQAERLCHVFGGTTVAMPVREVTRRMVHHLRHDRKLSHFAIGRQLRITERQVYRLLESPPLGMNGAAADPEDDRQMRMF